MRSGAEDWVSQSRVVCCGGGLLLLIWGLTTCAHRQESDPGSTFRQASVLRQRGELQQALTVANQGLAQFKNQTDSEWYARFLLLKAEVLLSQGKAPQASELLGGQASLPAGKLELRARLLLDQGWAEYSLSDFAKSKQLLDRALQMAVSKQLWDLAAETELRRGAVLTRSGDAAAGEADFHDALQLARDSKDTYLEASALGNLGSLCMNIARYDEAISWFNRALTLSGHFQSKSFVARTLNNLGECYVQLGQPEQAIPLFERAERLAAEMGELTDRQISLGRIGDSYQDNGNYKAALAYYQRALEVARQSHSQYWMANWLRSLAATSIETGDLAQAEDYNHQALALQARLGNPVERLWPQINAARIAEARQQLPEAESTYRSVIRAAENLSTEKDPGLVLEARARLARLLVRTNRDAEAETEFRQALALINTTRSELERQEYRISYFSTLLGFYQDYVDFLMARHREVEALRVAESSRARVLAERLGGIDPSRFRGTQYDYRKLAQTSKTILLSYWLAPQRSFLWVITPEKIASIQLPPQSEIEALVQAYEGAIEGLRDPVREKSSTGGRLYETLLAPAHAFLPPGSKVAIVPDGALHNLNFETLPTGGPEPHYWIQDVTISVIPSLDLLYRHTRRRPNQTGSILLIGDPVPADERSYPKLSNANLEISRIQRQFRQAVVHTGVAAQPDAYAASKPGQFSIIHFAAHAEANRDDPLDSAIILSPNGDTYKLYARDVVGLPIQASLVTISACRSAGGRTYAGEGLVGFAWAFLEAGARNVVAGLWEVDDRSTAELMDRMYSGLRRGQNPQQALRTAKLALCKSQGPFRKPYYWAPFQVITDSLTH